ncbi:lysis protein [Pseudomonas putida]|uniref:lysis protein n=1 Tax=Pseudomonas putida TaxID=303 RepID=UPI00216425F1|nr:lysis protein [Pseudomonas putida]
MSLNWRIALLAVAAGLYVGGRGAWLWQAREYGRQLADQAAGHIRQMADKDRAYGREREEAAATALDKLAEQRAQRQALEVRLQEQGKIHWQEMNHAQTTQARLRDRLATADLRLSVLVDAGAFATPGCDGGVRETAGPRG